MKTYCIQCTDKQTGKRGDFYFDTNNPFVAESPVFDSLADMFLWGKQFSEYRDAKFDC